MQRTLKRELKVLEIVKREAIGVSTCPVQNQAEAGCLRLPVERSLGCRLVGDGWSADASLRCGTCQHQ